MSGNRNLFRRACVVGWPARFSRSPLIHNTWLKEHGIAGSYGIEEVAEADFQAFLTGLSERGYVGCNVTVPHKVAAFTLVESRDEAAERLGAVNTVWIQKGQLAGANTDVHGFLCNLDAAVPGWDRHLGHAVMLGAGGAARAVLYGLLERKAARVTVVNRSAGRARELAGQFGPRVETAEWADLPEALGTAAILVNTTSLGMAGKPPLEIDLSPIPQGSIVNDIVYVPLETELLRSARRRGLAAVDGLGMLLHQAVPGFARWFGVTPSVTPRLRSLVAEDIGSG